MLPTPDLSHLTHDDYEHIYEPAEDTFILLDALEQDVDLLRKMSPAIVLEIGSGSGCVSTFTAQLLGRDRGLYLCTDINPQAAICTKATGTKNAVQLHPVITSLAQGFMPRLASRVDLLLFNPPYVPTNIVEAAAAQSTGDIAGAWAGGPVGMTITNELLNLVPTLLTTNGYFYLVCVKQNDPTGIASRAESELGLVCQVVLDRRAGRERLFVLRFARKRIQ